MCVCVCVCGVCVCVYVCVCVCVCVTVYEAGCVRVRVCPPPHHALPPHTPPCLTALVERMNEITVAFAEDNQPEEDEEEDEEVCVCVCACACE